MDDTIRSVMERHGIRAKKAYGQNFLGDPGLLRRIVGAAGVGPQDRVLEIGPGLGSLTWFLSQAAERVLAVELDRALLPVLQDTLSDCENVQILQGDAMKLDLDLVCRERLGEGPYDVVANLPYYITTPIVMKLLEASSARRVTVMVQREVAQRMVAAPGSKAYGVLSVMAQYYAAVSVALEVPAGAFVPRPAVDSALVRLDRLAQPAADAPAKPFRRMVQAGFAMRRKTLSNNLMSAYSLNRAGADALIRAAGIEPGVRAETLTLAQFAALTRAEMKNFQKDFSF